jgi:hypothetical protein
MPTVWKRSLRALFSEAIFYNYQIASSQKALLAMTTFLLEKANANGIALAMTLQIKPK